MEVSKIIRNSIEYRKCVFNGIEWEVLSESSANEIWYTTTDNEIYDLKSIIETLVSAGVTYNGPGIVSNEYDEEKQMWCMTFDDNVTVLGDFDIDQMIAEGPFFVNYQKYGIVCNVETIILPKTVNRIGEWAFFECSGLTSMTIPNSVTSIGDFAFWDCRGGEYIGGCYYLGNDVFVRTWAQDINDIVIREGTKYIEAESIGSYQTISFPSTTKIIGGTAIFRNGGGGAGDLISVTCYAITPPVINYNNIGHIDDTTVFYVPAQSVNAYKAAPGWSTYADRIQAISE